MKKKNIIIIFLVLLIIFVLSLLLFSNSDKQNVKYEKISNSIKEKIDNKGSFIIYIEDTKNVCTYCEDTIKFIKYLDEIYDLDIYYYDYSKLDEDDYKQVEKYLNVFEGFSIMPTIFLVKDGELKSGIPDLSREKDVISELLKYEFIEDTKPEMYFDEENDVLIDDNELLLIYSFEDSSYKYRKKLYDLARKYSFNYFVEITGYVRDFNYISEVRKKYKSSFVVPSIAVIADNKIIDYSSSNNEEDIISFLKKNRIIS